MHTQVHKVRLTLCLYTLCQVLCITSGEKKQAVYRPQTSKHNYETRQVPCRESPIRRYSGGRAQDILCKEVKIKQKPGGYEIISHAMKGGLK